MPKIEQIKLTPSSIIREVMQAIDREAMKITVVVDEDGHLIGALFKGNSLA